MCISLCDKIAEPSRLAGAPCLRRGRGGGMGVAGPVPADPALPRGRREGGPPLPPLPLPLRACGLENTRPDPQVSGVLTPPPRVAWDKRASNKPPAYARLEAAAKEKGGFSRGDRCPFPPACGCRQGPPQPPQGQAWFSTCFPLFGGKRLGESGPGTRRRSLVGRCRVFYCCPLPYFSLLKTARLYT